MSPSRPFTSAAQGPPPSSSPERLSRWFTRARRAGLLAALSPEAWHTLSAVLSFQAGDGRLTFSAEQLALALGQEMGVATGRLEQLAKTHWEALPLITPEYYLHGELAGVRLTPHRLFAPFTTESSETGSGAGPAGVQQVLPEKLRAKLEALQLTPSQIERLAAHHTADQIQKQLEWLPARSPRNPAAMLVRAIEEDWERPRFLEADPTATAAASTAPVDQAAGGEEVP